MGRIACTAALLLLAWTGRAFAQASCSSSQATCPFLRSFDAVPDKPTPTLNSGALLDGAKLVGPKSWRAAFLLDGTFGILALKEGEAKLGNLIPFRMDGHFFFAYQFHPRFDVAADLPVTIYQQDNFQLLNNIGFPTGGVSAAGFDDLRVLPRAVLLDSKDFPVGVAAVAEVRFPTGNRDSFLGGRGLGFNPRLTVERAFGPLRIIGNLGYAFRYYGQFLNLYVGNQFVMGGGAVYRFHDLNISKVKLSKLEATAEMVLATPTNAPFNFSQADSLKTPWELMVGARAKIHGRWGAELDLARGIGIQSGYGREAFRFIAGVRYDVDYSDRDGDGIPDDIDKCPDEPEDIDGFQDDDGCPDPDNDNDGIPDTEDACPNDPGPKEYDGCPDRDGDQIPDNVDKCPDDPGPAENDGCPVAGPVVVLETNRIRLRQNILFETAMAVIKPESFPILDQVAKVLKEHPELKHIEVQGHTDNIGSRPYNLDLSDRRAKAVVEYLIKKGIERKRLTPHGYGFDVPVAPNDTLIGRARNRRVEFNIAEKEKPEKKLEPGAEPPPAENPPETPAPAPKP